VPEKASGASRSLRGSVFLARPAPRRANAHVLLLIGSQVLASIADDDTAAQDTLRANSPEYCEIARKRIAAVEAQPTLFEPKPEQSTL